MVVALLFAGVMGNEAVAQVKSNSVKFNAFGMFAGQYQLAFERAINDKITIQLSGGLVSRKWELGTYEQKDGGFVIIPEARYYFNESMKGLYAGAFARYKSGSTTATDADGEVYYEASRSAVGGGAVLGYQFLIAERLVLDLFAGPQYKTTSSEVKTGTETALDLKGESDGIGARFGFNIGVAF